MKNKCYGQGLLSGVIVVGLAVASAVTSGEEITIVWPSEYEHAEAPDGSAGASIPSGGRNQWLIPGEAFSTLPGTHRRLISYNSRPDGLLGRADTVTWPSLKMVVSTTSADSLTDSFAENVDSEPTLVHDGPVTLSTLNTGPAGGPKDFDITVRFQEPFIFDPTSGDNLLFETQTEGPWRVLSWDEDLWTDNEPINQIWALDPLAEFAAKNDSSAVPTQYIFVPEPATALLAMLAFAIFIGCRIRRHVV